MAKRYYWLKLKEDFFKSPKIRKIRSMAGGDTYVLIYLKMQLYAMKHDGVIKYEGYEDDLIKEIAFLLDEPDNNVRMLMGYLTAYKLVEFGENSTSLYVPESVENTQSESSSTARVRKHRAEQKALHCNADVTKMKQICNVEKEKEKDIELEKDIDIDLEKEKEKDGVGVVDDWNKVFEYYTNNINFTPSPIEMERLTADYDQYGGRMMLKAIEIAVMNKARTLNYIEGVLKNWNDDTGITSDSKKKKAEEKPKYGF